MFKSLRAFFTQEREVAHEDPDTRKELHTTTASSGSKCGVRSSRVLPRGKGDPPRVIARTK